MSAAISSTAFNRHWRLSGVELGKSIAFQGSLLRTE
jgi:hypothetical protein